MACPNQNRGLLELDAMPFSLEFLHLQPNQCHQGNMRMPPDQASLPLSLERLQQGRPGKHMP